MYIILKIILYQRRHLLLIHAYIYINICEIVNMYHSVWIIINAGVIADIIVVVVIALITYIVVAGMIGSDTMYSSTFLFSQLVHYT